MSQLQINRADPAQTDALCALFSAYLRFYGKSPSEATVRQFLQDRLRLGQSAVFLARLNEQAVGFVQLYPSFSSLSMAPSWILNDLYVDESARGQGVAEALMNAARDLAESTGTAGIMLQTARDNSVAQRLYERLGYQRDDDFFVYALHLSRT
jgi:ribosomal protein S18 acetylase RimI-like enzyme